MNPKLGDAKVDKILSQYSIMYRNPNYISELLLPPLKVKEKTGKFAQYGKENLRVYTDGLFRAPGTRAATVDYSVSQGTYECRERSLEKLVPDEFINNSDDPYDPKRDAVAVLMDNIWGNQERALQQAMTATGTMTSNTTLTGADQWSNDASTPLTDIETGITTVLTNIGRRPNTLVLCHDVFMKLKYHPDVREQLKYTNGGQLTDEATKAGMAALFNVSKVIVGDAVFNNSDPGQSDSMASIWSKDAWLLYIPERPSLMMPAFGYTFFDVARLVDTYREEPKVSDVVRVRYSYDQNLVDVTAGYLIKNAIA